MATNYIDRNALIEHIKKDPLFDFVEQYGITGVIESFPPADVQPVKHWRWVRDAVYVDETTGEPCLAWFCNQCGEPQMVGTNFCPHCGAKMDMDGET
mgnify:CR=1 FL=1